MKRALLLALLICACPSCRTSKPAPSVARPAPKNQWLLQPLLPPRVPSKKLVPTGPEKALSIVRLSWQPSGAVTIETSADLRAWSTFTNTSDSTILVPVSGQQQFFRGKAQGAVTIAWDPSPSPFVSSYLVYQGGESHNYTNLAATVQNYYATFNGGSPGQTFYFAVVAVDAAGLQSDPSNEASFTYPDTWMTWIPLKLTPQ